MNNYDDAHGPVFGTCAYYTKYLVFDLKCLYNMHKRKCGSLALGTVASEPPERYKNPAPLGTGLSYGERGAAYSTHAPQRFSLRPSVSS